MTKENGMRASRAIGFGVAVAVVALGVWISRTPPSSKLEGLDGNASSRPLSDALPVHEPAFERAEGEQGVPNVIPVDASQESTLTTAQSQRSRLIVEVVDGKNAPVAGALVTRKTAAPLQAVSTDQDGLAELDVSGATEVDIVARHPEFRFGKAHSEVAQQGTTRVRIQLGRAVTVCIRLESPGGAPVGGAEVRFRECEEPDLNHLGLFLGTVEERDDNLMRDWFEGQFQESRISEADGQCCVSGVLPGLINISVDARGFVYVDQYVVEVPEGGGDLGVIRLESGVLVSGIVSDSAGLVPGALVEACLGTNVYKYVETDSNGRFELGSMKNLPYGVPLRVSHITRGDYYNAEEDLARGLVQVSLVPSTEVSLRLTDAATGRPIEGEYVRTASLPQDLLLYKYSMRKTLMLDGGLTVTERLPYYSSGLTIEVKEYPRTFVGMDKLKAAAGATIDITLSKAHPLFIKATDKASGEVVLGGAVCSILDKSTATDVNRFSSRIAPTFDAMAGGYYVEASRFNAEPGADEYLIFFADGYEPSEKVIVSKDGVWTAGDSISFELARK
jgi:hypothetical protein